MPPENLPAPRGHLEPRDEDATQVPRGLRAVLLIYKPDGTRAGYDIDSPEISVEAHHEYADFFYDWSTAGRVLASSTYTFTITTCSYTAIVKHPEAA